MPRSRTRLLGRFIRAAGLAETKSGATVRMERERTRRGGGDGLRSSGPDRGPGGRSPPCGMGADHRPDLLAAQLRLADVQPEARGRDRGVGGCLGLLRGRSQVPGDRQLPRSSGGCRSAPSPSHARLPGVLPAPGLHLRPGAGAPSPGQAARGTWGALRAGAVLQGRGVHRPLGHEVCC